MTVIEVCAAVIADARAVLAESRLATACWTAFRAAGMFAGVIWVVVAHPPVPDGVTGAWIAAAAAVVPCWPRAIVQVVFPVPATAVTRRISEPTAA